MTQDEIDREMHEEGNCGSDCPYCVEDDDEDNIFHKVGCKCKECEKNFAEHKYDELINN